MGTCVICGAEIKEHPAFGLCDKCAQLGWTLLEELKSKKLNKSLLSEIENGAHRRRRKKRPAE